MTNHWGSVAGYGPDNRGMKVRLSAGTRHFYLIRTVLTGSGAHPAYSMDDGNPFPRGKSTRTSGCTSSLPQALMACLGATLPLSNITQFWRSVTLEPVPLAYARVQASRNPLVRSHRHAITHHRVKNRDPIRSTHPLALRGQILSHKCTKRSSLIQWAEHLRRESLFMLSRDDNRLCFTTERKITFNTPDTSWPRDINVNTTLCILTEGNTV